MGDEHQGLHTELMADNGVMIDLPLDMESINIAICRAFFEPLSTCLKCFVFTSICYCVVLVLALSGHF